MTTTNYKILTLEEARTLINAVYDNEDYLGCGSSRAVYSISDEVLCKILGDAYNPSRDSIVLKLAFCNGGRHQGVNELAFVDYLAQHNHSNYFVRIFAATPDGSVMLVEAVQPDDDYGEVINYLYEDYDGFIEDDTDIDIERYRDTLVNTFGNPNAEGDACTIALDNFRDSREMDMCEALIRFNDCLDCFQIGIGSDGRTVIFDAGFQSNSPNRLTSYEDEALANFWALWVEEEGLISSFDELHDLYERADSNFYGEVSDEDACSWESESE